jgi:hypothetical protein
MSGFKIGNKEINHISGPIRVCVLKPPQSLKKEFEKEGCRAPYILLFGDEHFGKENECKKCSCDWADEDDNECCYKIDDPKFLKLFDSAITSNFPIDLYVEQAYEPRLGDPNIYNINKEIKYIDTEGFISKFIHDYKICYSKQHRSTLRYQKDCPTKDIRWHFIDIRNIEYGKSGEHMLNSGTNTFYTILYKYFNKDNKYTKEDVYNIAKKYINDEYYKEELTMMYYIIINGPQFVKDYITENSNFIIAKQIRKQVIDKLKNFSFWHNIISERINFYFKHYFKNSGFIVDDYLIVMRFYKDVILLLFEANNKTKEEFEEERLNLIQTIEKYDLFSKNILNLNNMLTMTVLACMVDIYTISRIFKRTTNGTPSFLSMIYSGDIHIENIKDILINYLGYSIIGEVNNEGRCQDVSNINFNLLKAKSEYT